jgi:peptidyl-prolyl cis-trans isomerase SurA
MNLKRIEMKYITFLCCMIGWGYLMGQKPVILDKVVAQVGSEVILWSEVEEYYAYQKANYGKMPEDARCNILDNLMLKALLVSEAKLDTLIIVSDAEVEDNLNRRIDEILFMMNGDVVFFQDYYGKTVNEVKNDMRDDLRNQLLSERMQGSVIRNIKITPAEVKSFFEKIPRDSLPYFQSEVEISEIIFKPKVNDTEKKKAIQKLEELKNRYQKGEDFAVLAKNHSDDPGSARLGGELGWQKRGAFVQQFEEAAYRLDIGELSEIVESDFGFHLIQMLERRGNSFKTRHILIRPEITQSDIELTKKTVNDVRKQILDKKITFEAAVKEYSDDKAQSYTNAGRVVNPKTSNTFFEIADLEYDVFFAIDSMKVGGISGPIEIQDDDGSVYFKMIQLNSRSTPHRANLNQDFSKIKQAAVEQKKASFLDTWVKEKSESTYVEIDPEFQTCKVLTTKWKGSRKTSTVARP